METSAPVRSVSSIGEAKRSPHTPGRAGGGGGEGAAIVAGQHSLKMQPATPLKKSSKALEAAACVAGLKKLGLACYIALALAHAAQSYRRYRRSMKHHLIASHGLRSIDKQQRARVDG